MDGKREPMSNDNGESTDLDPRTSAPMFEDTVPYPSPCKKYDVFLSFRGADTRKEFVSYLYHELKTVRGFETFIDDKDLEMGDTIFPTLQKAIEDSTCAIVVLSANYAQSPWCLEELSKICQCMKHNISILPVFYHVEPSDVGHQRGAFADAFDKHENSGRHNSEKVKKWREALKIVAKISGCNTKDHKTERGVLDAVMESVCKRVRPIEIEFMISSRDFEQYKATREAMEKVMNALRDKDVTAVGVRGMGGVGKTTMVEHIGVEAQRKGLFHLVIMAEISRKPNLGENPNLRDIQGRLAYMLGFKLEVDGDYPRACTLRKRILSKDRILIILDNIWNEIEVTRIGIPSYEELKRRNSKVLLTTRRLEVCHLLDCDEIISLDTLDIDDSWKLFAKMAKELKAPPYIAKKVASECGGLPVALIAVAKALRGKHLNQWEEAAYRLEESKPLNPEDGERVFKCIKLSFDYLKTEEYRFCFLLCCLFPEGSDIQVEALLKYGIWKGLFQGNMQTARSRVHSMVEFLKDSSLLSDGELDRGCVRMHDVVRDVAVSISLSKDGQQFFVRAGCKLSTWPIDAHGCYAAISLMKNKIDTLPQDLVCSELQILLLQINTYKQIPDSFFQSLKALRVLDLSHTSISLLPSSFNYLSSLHTLYLDECNSEIRNISLLGKLGNLEILSMRKLLLEKLPKEVGLLTKLRILDFTSESVYIVPPNVISRLSRLEELYMQCNFVDWKSNVEGCEAEGAREEINSFFDELTSLPYLHNLKFCISSPECLPTNVDVRLNWNSFDICIAEDPLVRGSPPDSKALTLDTTINTLPEWFIDVVVKKTEKLQYINCCGLGNLLEEYHQGTLVALKYLHIIGPSLELEQLMTPITLHQDDRVFENLEELRLDEVNFLKELCVGELQIESLCKLRLLEVKNCPQLMNALLQPNLLRRLKNLEILICEDLDELEYVFAYEAERITLTELTEMRLNKLGNLIKIWNGPAECAVFHHVKVLAVNLCSKLKYLFTSQVAKRLDKLEDLTVEDCYSLERVIEASQETVNDKIGFPKLKNLALINLQKLTRFYGSMGSATTDEENIEFPLLESSHVERCRLFKSPAQNMLVQ